MLGHISDGFGVIDRAVSDLEHMGSFLPDGCQAAVGPEVQHSLGNGRGGRSTGKLFRLELLPIIRNTDPKYVCAISQIFCRT